MAQLPDKDLLDGSKLPETTTGEFRSAMGILRDYLAGLLGTDSTDKAAARAILGAAGDYVTNAGGTADAITGVFFNEIKELKHGLSVLLRANVANTTSAPTFRADLTSAITIVKANNLSLKEGDIAGEGHWLELQYDEALNKWVLQNPATGVLEASQIGQYLNFHTEDKIATVSLNGGSSGSKTLTLMGSFVASGNVSAYSDECFKEGITIIDHALDKVRQLRGVTYKRKLEPNAVRQMGVIAQEVQKVIPEVVLEDEKGMLSVAYGNIVGLLIEAIKEQQGQIDALREALL